MGILRTENLTKEYGIGDNKVIALDHVSFMVKEGEFVTILGPSGSGKSTLLHLLGGVDKPTDGKVYIGGHSIYDMKEKELTVFRRREIGQIYQFYNLIPVLNVEENISLPVLLDNQKVDKEYLEQLLQILGLNERVKHLPSELSGGQQQRVAIGRALMGKPKIENTSLLYDLAEYNVSEQIRSCILLLENKWSKKNIDFNLDFDEYTV